MEKTLQGVYHNGKEVIDKDEIKKTIDSLKTDKNWKELDPFGKGLIE